MSSYEIRAEQTVQGNGKLWIPLLARQQVWPVIPTAHLSSSGEMDIKKADSYQPWDCCEHKTNRDRCERDVYILNRRKGAW